MYSNAGLLLDRLLERHSLTFTVAATDSWLRIFGLIHLLAKVESYGSENYWPWMKIQISDTLIRKDNCEASNIDVPVAGTWLLSNTGKGLERECSHNLPLNQWMPDAINST